jgi:HTH-type transcriptional regulator/antitoxin HigA
MGNVNGLSLDLLIHPGETLKEVLGEKNMSQEELAIRTEYSPKHISEVVRGKKDISSEFANRLEYALGIPAHFWMNLQGNYDKEVFEINSVNNIEEKELSILKDLKEVVKFCENENIIECNSKKEITVLNMRKFLNLNNLCSISSLPIQQAAFRGSKKNKVNVYVLYAWQKLCEYFTNKVTLKNEYDKEKLKTKYDDIKKTMFLPANEMVKELKNIFSECGIAFDVVQHFTGAPVQGFIQKKNNKVILCMTIRQSFSDIFWFTLFHEIGHLINDDFSNQYIDYQFVSSKEEKKADDFAKNMLINQKEYDNFIKNNNINYSNIKRFAEDQNVIPSVVIGRIQNDMNDYTFMSRYKTQYKWCN